MPGLPMPRSQLPFVVLPLAGAVGGRDGPVKVLPVEAGGVRRAPPEHHLPAQETVVPSLVRRRPALVVRLCTRYA